jgi:hypothetical protein
MKNTIHEIFCFESNQLLFKLKDFLINNSTCFVNNSKVPNKIRINTDTFLAPYRSI